MSTLHTRGHRPEPGERDLIPEYPGSTRHLWNTAWTIARQRKPVFFRSERLARECYDEREAPDPLHVAAGKRLGLSGLMLQDPDALCTMLAALGVT